MSYVYLESWPYDDRDASLRKATDLFEKLRAGLVGTPGIRFPYGGGCEVGLIESAQWWMVAVEAPGDPPDDAVASIGAWFADCGGSEQPNAAEVVVVGDETLSEAVTIRGWGRLVRTLDTAPV